MDQDSMRVLAFLEGIAMAQDRFQQMRLRLQSDPKVTKVTVSRYSPSHISRDGIPTLDGHIGLSAEMTDGAIVDWWLELWHDARIWHLDYNIYRSGTDVEYSQIAVPFAEKHAETLDTFLAALSEAVHDLETGVIHLSSGI